MNITELCNERRATLLPRWTELFFAAYPLDGPGFLRTQTDPFANPVGRIVRESLPVLYDAAAGNDVEPDAVHAALADLMRLRAVQDMPPAKAVGPVFCSRRCCVKPYCPNSCVRTPGAGTRSRV